MRVLILAALTGCIDGVPDTKDPDTGDTDTGATGAISFGARIQVGCANEDCSDVEFFGDASGDDVASYQWTVRGEDAGTGSTTTATISEPGELVTVTLTVTDSNNAQDTASMTAARLDYTLDEKGTSGFDPGFATIAMPDDIPCGSPLGIANIGGCVRQNEYLHFVAKDVASNAGFRGDPVIYDADLGGMHFVTNDSFLDSAAWYQGLIHGGQVQYHKMSDADYSVLGGTYSPIARDPVVLNALGLSAQAEDHFTLWFTPLQQGTEVFASHVNLTNGQPIFHERKITVGCADGGWVFDMVPITEDDALQFPVLVKPAG